MNRLKITAFKQKTFQIVKERTMREASRDHSRSHGTEGLTWARVIARHRGVTRQVYTVWSWWSQPGSNRRPSGCKPDALPAELWPLTNDCWILIVLVGLGGVAPPTSPLSGVRSN
jgi:hypothetical protein